MGNGSYVGMLVKLDDHGIEISELDSEGKPYNLGWEPEVTHWPWARPKHAEAALNLGLEPGDRVEVHVEFENYKAFHVDPFDWNPRRLHERLLRIEKHLELDT
jgi:hypothetical protein